MHEQFSFEPSTQIHIPTAQELEACDDGARVICLISGTTEEGEDGWLFLAVRPTLYLTFFMSCKEGGTLLPEAYGEIIEHGVGLPPPIDVVKRMKKEYGFDPHFSDRLVKEAQKQQKAYFTEQEALHINAIVATLKAKQNTDQNF